MKNFKFENRVGCALVLQSLCFTQLIKTKQNEAEISVLFDFKKSIKIKNLINYNEISQVSVVDSVASVFFLKAIFSFFCGIRSFFVESQVYLAHPRSKTFNFFMVSCLLMNDLQLNPKEPFNSRRLTV